MDLIARLLKAGVIIHFEPDGKYAYAVISRANNQTNDSCATPEEALYSVVKAAIKAGWLRSEEIQ